jgi:predicted restriction endonuclease
VIDPEEFGALSELIEGTEIFAERNLRGNHMYGAALNNYARYLAHIVDTLVDTDIAAGPFNDQLVSIEHSEAELHPFEPKDQEDGRDRVLRGVVRRQGQPRFRANLIGAYEGRCAITHCPVLVILEAAHVTPYLGPQTNSITNGLLLRADIHTLWDLGLIAIDPNSMTVSVNPGLQDPSYQALAGAGVFQPVAMASRVSHPALAQQWAVFRAHLASGR